MPEVVVAWYDREDEEAGYHICENCRIGRNIDTRHIEITSEEQASERCEPCSECVLRLKPQSQRPRGKAHCREITIRTT